MSRSYELLYRFMALTRIPKRWVFGSGEEILDSMLNRHPLPAGRAIDLGCGAGTEAVFLAQRGFEVTGVDLSPTAIGMARRRAASAGVDVDWRVADLTVPLEVDDGFDLLVDLGALNDIPPKGRDGYAANVLRLARPGSRYVLLGFEQDLPRSERQERFGDAFAIETVADLVEPLFRRRMVTSLLTRHVPAAAPASPQSAP